MKLTYLTLFGFIPIALYWFANVANGYRMFNLKKVPLWLVSTIALFWPICFTNDKKVK